MQVKNRVVSIYGSFIYIYTYTYIYIYIYIYTYIYIYIYIYIEIDINVFIKQCIRHVIGEGIKVGLYTIEYSYDGGINIKVSHGLSI